MLFLQGESGMSDLFLDEKNILHHRNKEIIATKVSTDSIKPANKDEVNIIKLNYSNLSKETLQLRAAAEFSYVYDLVPVDGICI